VIPAQPQFIDAAEVSSLPPGRGRTVELRGKRLALFHVGDQFHAIDDDCPHRGGSLGTGWCENGEVYCPLHGWAFDIATGTCKTRADRPVKSYPTQVRDGRVWIAL
jgi:nitrite reductase/ring-hydroxylating ferredoxin subunit